MATQTENQEYNRFVVSAGARGGLVGILLGLAATASLHRFYAPFRQLPLYIKSTFVAYPGLLLTSIGANEGSHAYQRRVHPELSKVLDESQRLALETRARESRGQRIKDWIYNHRLHVLGGTWATSMAVCLELMRRDHYLTVARKIVQARVLAQAVTLAVLLVTAAIETSDKRKGRGKYQKVRLAGEQVGERARSSGSARDGT